MNTVVFDGLKFAREKELLLRDKIRELRITPRLMSVVFNEDASSQLYTRLKFEAAWRVGVEFDRCDHSMKEDVHDLAALIRNACGRSDVHGVMIQKPSRSTFEQVVGKGASFNNWWRMLTSSLQKEKDVDCLSKRNLDRVYAGEWKLLPATVKAVISILSEALSADLLEMRQGLEGLKVVVVGRSEIVGRPLAAVLEQFGAEVNLCGRKVEDLGKLTIGADVVVTATGRPDLITGEMVKEGVIVVDVGEPRADVNFEEVKEKAMFITPVPGGVGPVTVVSLLENLAELFSLAP